ncbi:MAG: RNA polymerase sigma-70 factor [bacterium]
MRERGRPKDPLQSTSPRDADLVARIQSGEVSEFERFFRMEFAPLCGFADRYLHDRAASEDLVQQLFADLWEHRATWNPRFGVRAYLFAAVRNRALNVRKRQVVERDWELEEAAPSVRTLHPMPLRPDELFAARDLRATLDALLAGLPERCRLVMLLRWREQLSYAEIAAIMEISVKGVENQLGRGVRALRARMEDLGD